MNFQIGLESLILQLGVESSTHLGRTFFASLWTPHTTILSVAVMSLAGIISMAVDLTTEKRKK